MEYVTALIVGVFLLSTGTIVVLKIKLDKEREYANFAKRQYLLVRKNLKDTDDYLRSANEEIVELKEMVYEGEEDPDDFYKELETK